MSFSVRFKERYILKGKQRNYQAYELNSNQSLGKYNDQSNVGNEIVIRNHGNKLQIRNVLTVS
ncbi:hypothetical protein AXF42_Ash008467 [Apostasia shenzhenica]|uniref:Uncharacterized protein n=1 Tax=Apostasia shenzhenica TaxID=1088818 RepID=A0A2I0AXY2_9ASPA|nr:hypothetical protein AXF42_Ash008467 [Apostasia shenzhenica]